jgi:hypothetical protein
MRWRAPLAFWGVGAGAAVGLFLSDVPIFQRDVLKKIPVVSLFGSALLSVGREDSGRKLVIGSWYAGRGVRWGELERRVCGICAWDVVRCLRIEDRQAGRWAQSEHTGVISDEPRPMHWKRRA